MSEGVILRDVPGTFLSQPGRWFDGRLDDPDLSFPSVGTCLLLWGMVTMQMDNRTICPR